MNSPLSAFMTRFSPLFHGILSCVLIIAIEAISRHSLISALSFVVTSPLTFLYNALLVFASLMLVYLVKRRTFLRFVLSIFWLLLGTINGVVLANRVTPFNFTDLKLVNDLLNMTNSKYLSFGQIVLIIAALIVLGVLLVVLSRKAPKFQGKVHRLRNLGLLALCVISIPFITKAAIHSNVLAGYFGNLAQGYKDYGFVYSFSASVVDTGMSQPDGYSEESVNDVLDSVSSEETALDEEDMPNIIFVQLESFIDPTEVEFLEMSEDPIPNFRSLMENYSSGYLTVPVVGAGTANTEFEVMTGMSLQYFGLGEYPFKTILKETEVESVAYDLRQAGYATHAMHNNGGNFYGRATIFDSMGYDSYTSKELMNITEYNEIETWPADSILVEETTKVLDSTEDQADFLYTITVQSHGSYPDYEVFTDEDSIEVSGCDTEEENYQWEYFVNEMKAVDDFIGDLIEELEQRDEKTLVVFYGDHLPTMGLEEEDMATGSLYNTIYATWDNFGLEKEDKDLTTYQLAAYFMDRLDIHEGTIFTYHQSEMANGDTESSDYLDGLELLQYDMLYGDDYVYGGEQPVISVGMIMGTEEVVAEEITAGSDDQLYITGQNFTPWSKVYINDEAVDTTYISENCLAFASDTIEDGDSVVVNQVGSSSTVFRSSNTIIAENVAKLIEYSAAGSGQPGLLESVDNVDEMMQNAAKETIN